MKTILKSGFLLLATLVAVCRAADVPPAATGCETVGAVQGICGFPAPEDIDVMPGGSRLLLSPVGGMAGEHPVPFHLFDVQTAAVRPLAIDVRASDDNWGDSACAEPPAAVIAGHGIHISRRADGLWQLLAVNHAREAVEFFEIGGSEDKPSLQWRGCAIMPPGSAINDVAALPGGGFLVSNMFDTRQATLEQAMASAENTGYLWRWQPGQGFDKLPGSDGRFPNGVAVSSDGNYVYMSETGGQQVRKFDYRTGATAGVLQTGPVDNLSWAPDGRLIATAITGPVPATCFTEPGPCLAPFKVMAIDTTTMTAATLHEQTGPPMGASSVAVVHRGSLYVGTFAGNQMMRVQLLQRGQ